jgi:hypothetical protein
MSHDVYCGAPYLLSMLAQVLQGGACADGEGVAHVVVVRACHRQHLHDHMHCCLLLPSVRRFRLLSAIVKS